MRYKIKPLTYVRGFILGYYVSETSSQLVRDADRSVPLPGVGLDEVAVLVEVFVEPARDLGCLRSVGGQAAAQEDYRHDASVRSVRIGGKPAKAGAVLRAGSGFA